MISKLYPDAYAAINKCIKAEGACKPSVVLLHANPQPVPGPMSWGAAEESPMSWGLSAAAAGDVPYGASLPRQVPHTWERCRHPKILTSSSFGATVWWQRQK